MEYNEYLTYEEAKQAFDIDPDIGILLWKIKASKKTKPGSIAGCAKKNRSHKTPCYAVRYKGVDYQAHRIAWLLYYGTWPEKDIDHINHNGLDNRKINLRSVTCSENNKNRPLLVNNKSGYNGIRIVSGNKFMVRINVNKQEYYLGTFKNKSEAIKARKMANIFFNFHQNHGV